MILCALQVVSGAGNKRALDSLSTLQRAACSAPPPLPLGCVFNPHIGGELDPYCGEDHREKEWERLRQKLRSGAVTQVWVAFGADVAALSVGLGRLKRELELLAAEDPPVLAGAGVALMGSVFVPSKTWINKMRFRCWQGTFLGGKDDEGAYLSSQECASVITQQVLALYRTHGVEPVVESAVRSVADVDEAVAMLKAVEQAATAGEELPPHGTAGGRPEESRWAATAAAR